MHIGIDLDNTIINYAGVFHQVANDLGWIPSSVGQSKAEVKQHFIDNDNEVQWTELQGLVYGKEIYKAKPYPGCIDALRELNNQGYILSIISHKTRYPVIGDRVNLQEAAKNWLVENKITGINSPVIPLTNIFFRETKSAKIQTIREKQCGIFIDDLVEILTHTNFPSSTKCILFSEQAQAHEIKQIKHWNQLLELI